MPLKAVRQIIRLRASRFDAAIMVVIITIFVIVGADLVATLWKDNTSSTVPTQSNTEAYVSHGKTLYVSPLVFKWERRLRIATPVVFAIAILLLLNLERLANKSMREYRRDLLRKRSDTHPAERQ